MVEAIPITGGGPAGAAAGLAVTRAGAKAVIFEQSALPRHKLCGEFFSPEIAVLFEQLGVMDGFRALGPARVTHAETNFLKHHHRFRLPEPAWGLSRYALDDFLLRAAAVQGAELRRERRGESGRIAIVASGRTVAQTKSRSRLFGFKAHFEGPASDAVELFFFQGGYTGICAIENRRTNVCGIAQEGLLRENGFLPDPLIASAPHLAARLRQLARITPWHVRGPLRFGRAAISSGPLFPAGDAMRFIDPFTGSGLLAAVQTGIWAAAAAMQAADGGNLERCWADYQRQCRSFYSRQSAAAAILRRFLSLGCAEFLAGLLPGRLLFRLTRPGEV
jgi:flavin-dependent dehydrogenase